MQDEEILRQLREHPDPRLFELLVERYRGPVVRLVLALLGPRLADDAEDVTQEVFLRAYEGLAGFRQESRFATWLYRITYNLALDRLRRAARRPVVALDEERRAELSAPGESPFEHLARSDRARLVRDCLEELPPPYQAALRLFYWLDVPVEEIAALLGVSVGTVKSYLCRGRTRLIRVLERRGVGR